MRNKWVKALLVIVVAVIVVIIPLHVMYKSRSESLKEVKGVGAGLKGQGYSFKTVSEMLAMAD
jgi:uncharacterized protein YoxC